MNRRKIALLPVVLLAIYSYLIPLVRERIAFATTQPAPREVAPNFSLTALTGNRIQLGDYRGKVVLVNFFASWCPPCRMEMPGFQKTYAAYRNRDFTVIGIALDDVAPSFPRSMGITYPIVMATNQVIKNYGNVYSIPISFLVGKDGRIIKKTIGPYSETSLKNDIEQALRGH